MSSTQIILLEHVEKLGSIGDLVKVKPGFRPQFSNSAEKSVACKQRKYRLFRSAKEIDRSRQHEKEKRGRKTRQEDRRDQSATHTSGV